MVLIWNGLAWNGVASMSVYLYVCACKYARVCVCVCVYLCVHACVYVHGMVGHGKAQRFRDIASESHENHIGFVTQRQNIIKHNGLHTLR